MSEHDSEAANPRRNEWYRKPVTIAGIISTFIAGLAGLVTNYQTIINIFKGNDISIKMIDQTMAHTGVDILVSFSIDNSMSVSATDCNIMGWAGRKISASYGGNDFSIPAHASGYILTAVFREILDYQSMKAQISCKDHSSNNLDIKIR